MGAPDSSLSASAGGSSRDRLFAEIRYHLRRRIFEVWCYAAGLCTALAILGWLVTGVPQIAAPFAAVGVSGGLVGTLLAFFRARDARRQIEKFVTVHGNSRSLAKIDREIDQNPDEWPDGSAIRGLTQRLFS